MGVAIFDEKIPYISGIRIVAADGTGQKSLVTLANGPWRVDTILVASTCATDRVLKIEYYVTAGWLTLASIAIPAGSGSAGVKCIDVGPAQAPAAQGGWVMAAGGQLTFSVTVALTGAEAITVAAFGGYL